MPIAFSFNYLCAWLPSLTLIMGTLRITVSIFVAFDLLCYSMTI